jgi:hypothetical protein
MRIDAFAVVVGGCSAAVLTDGCLAMRNNMANNEMHPHRRSADVPHSSKRASMSRIAL